MAGASSRGQLWTLGIWLTQSGQEDAFQTAWTEFAQWTAEHQPGALEAYLLQDPQQPQRFFSFGPWESSEAIQAWRESPEFGAFVGKVTQLCDNFQPNMLHLVSHVEWRSNH